MRFALSVGRVHTSSVFVMKSSVLIVDHGKPLRSRTERLTAAGNALRRNDHSFGEVSSTGFDG